VLLDAEDGSMIKEIPVIDDHAIGEPDAGDQRVPNVVYNPDKDEFFVIWEVDEQPTVDDSAIRGRFLNPDGSFKGDIFTMVDAPRQQHWPDIEYIQEEQKYFMVWNDCRNDGLPPETPWYLSPAIDVYARWLDDTGSPVGDEILIAEREGAGENWKQVPIMAYSPVKKRFLIAWYDRHAAGGDTPFSSAPSDVKATLYGVPASNPCPASKIYGEGSEEVKLLRNIRDNILDKSPEGKALIELYYQLGPAVVKMMEDNGELKETVKGMIDTILY
jgi:hypothetical protein